MGAERAESRKRPPRGRLTARLRAAVERLLASRRHLVRRAVPPLPTDPLPDLKVLITAEEAFVEFERLVLSAQDRIVAGFRIFDPDTTLLSDAARERGDTWGDLITDALRRGVRVSVTLTDFDPVAAPELHAQSWASASRWTEIAAACGCAEGLRVRVHMHPAKAGWTFRVAGMVYARRSLSALSERLNMLGPEEAALRLRNMPGLAPLLRRDGAGGFRPVRLPLHTGRPATHHQKLAVIDGRALYIGGLDLDDRRIDGKEHARAGRRTWADVQLSLTGPIAAEAESHLKAFGTETASGPNPSRPGLLRTVSVARGPAAFLRLGPKPRVTELLDMNRAGIAAATRLIYLETQFLRDLHFARDLARRGRDMPGLRLIVVLPAAPEDLAFNGATGRDMRFAEHLQSRCVEMLARAYGDRAVFVSPAQPRGLPPDGSRAVLHGAPLVYVHSKVSVFDERLGIVSSANLNGRSHRWDTEAGVATGDPGQVRHLRTRCMRHWLPDEPDPALLDPETAPAAWAALAARNRDTPPARRDGFLLPYPRSAPRRFGRPMPGMTQDIV